MKKLLVVVLVCALMFTLISCAPKEEPTTPAETQVDAPVESGTGLEEAASAYFADYPGSRIVEWADLFAMIDNGDEPYILSIRSEEDYNKGHIEGAYLAAWGTDLADKVAMLPKDETVYVYCYSGQTAGQTIALLNMMGVDAVSVKSGFVKGAMTVEGYEDYVETDVNDMPDAEVEFNEEVLSFVEEYFAAIPDGGSNIMAVEEVDDAVDTGDYVVVDIRKPEDFEAGHVEDAISLPFGENMQEGFADLPDDVTLIVACYSGQTAGQTTAVLKALGYDAVSMKYGMKLGYAPYKVKMAATSYFADYEGSNIVEWADLFAKIDAGEKPYILSIRNQEDYDAGHIKGAYLAAWGTDLAEKAAMLPTDETVYVYCYSGQTAGQTIAQLRMMGVDAVSVKSGFVKGAMTVDGYEAYVETEANEMESAEAEFEPFVAASVKAYFAAIPEGGSNIMEVEDVKTAVEAGEVTVVDIRTAEDFAAGHVEGAVNVPFGKDMQAGFEELEGKLVVACYSGQTAGQTTAIMKSLGYDAVSMKYGMKLGWLGAEYPVVAE